MSTENEFRNVRDIAESDLDFLTDLLDADMKKLPGESDHKVQAIRRLYVRIVVSAVESAISTFRQEALEVPSMFTEEELLLLKGILYELADNGKVIEKQAHAQFFSSFRFAFQMLAKARGLCAQPDYSLAGWQALQHTVRLRNRLTHPKSVLEMQVSDNDMTQVDAAEVWFRLANNALMEEYSAQLERKITALRSTLSLQQSAFGR
jgi:hypothetical protein